MSNPLRILQVSPRLPYPPNDGGRIGIFNITKHLALRGHRITMAVFTDAAEIPEELAEYAAVVPVRHDTRTTLPGLARNLFSPLPYTISKYQTEKMEEVLRALCDGQEFDVAHIDHLHCAPYGRLLKEEFRIPYCLREHNYETQIYERFSDAQGFSLLKSYMRMQSRRIRRFEREQIDKTDLCMAITDEDARQIARESSAPLAVIPAGVDLEEHPLLDRRGERAKSILILGSLSWQPNIDAALWFLDEIFPRILKEEPEARVTIAGMSPSKKLRARRSERVSIPGFVDDLRGLVAATQVLAIPLRIGGGMRIKMLEYFAAGKAVVSTSVGAEGNRAEPGRHYLRADTPEEFATAVATLFRSEQERTRLGDAARRFVEERCAWSRIAEMFEESYRRVIAGEFRR